MNLSLRFSSGVFLGFLLAIAALSPTTGCATGGTGGVGGGDGGGPSTSASSGGDAGSDAPVPCTGPTECASFTDACNTGACINGTCGKLSTNEGAACDDGKECTVGTTCNNGVCEGGTLKSCTSTKPCFIGSCDTALDACVEVPGNNGSPCVDDDACTTTGACSNGVCIAGGQVDCSFLDGPCSLGICDPQLGCQVMPLANGAPCDDGLFCTINDACNGGACAGFPNPCTPPGNPCFIGSCSELNGCSAVPGNNGAACDDGNLCTAGETCSNGTCAGGQPANNGVACDDGDGCTAGTTCNNGACSNATSTITACVNGDSCCPANCAVDDDCTINVLLVAADDTFLYDDVQAKLLATGAFTAVDVFDAQFGTPSLAQLTTYKAVLVWSNFLFADPFALGNVLADYFDAGGRVVLAPGAACTGVELAGRFITDGYSLINVGTVDQAFPADSLGLVSEPQSLLMTGVTTLSATMSARCLGGAKAGATTVASWGLGPPLIVRGTVNGKNRVDLNLFPPSDDAASGLWIGDGAKILKNALFFH